MDAANCCERAAATPTKYQELATGNWQLATMGDEDVLAAYSAAHLTAHVARVELLLFLLATPTALVTAAGPDLARRCGL